MNAPLPRDAASRAERQREAVAALSAVLPAHALLWQSEDTIPYECDGLTAYRERPLVVALPETEAQVAAALPDDLVAVDRRLPDAVMPAGELRQVHRRHVRDLGGEC